MTRRALDLLHEIDAWCDERPRDMPSATEFLPEGWDVWTDELRQEWTDGLLVSEAERAIRDRMFWSAVDTGLRSGSAAWGKLYADLRGWTGRGVGNVADPTAAERLTPEQAAALIRAAQLEESGEDG